MPKVKSVGVADVKKARFAVDRAKRDLDDKFNSFYSTVEPMAYDDTFWSYIKDLTEIYAGYTSRFTNLSNPNMSVMSRFMEGTTEELARQIVCGQSKTAGRTFEEFICFAKAYEKLESELSSAIDEAESQCNFSIEKSDDGFGDFTDLLPLAGKDVCEGILAKKFKSRSAIFKAIKAAVPSWLNKTIVEGECYTTSGLTDAIKTFI